MGIYSYIILLRLKTYLMPEDPFQPALFVGANSVYGILGTVRNTVLEWALRLEHEGIVGEGLSFSAEEKKKAKENPNINIQHFQGIIGNLSDSFISQDFGTHIHVGDLDGLS